MWMSTIVIIRTRPTVMSRGRGGGIVARATIGSLFYIEMRLW